jgi:periplasmic glucans biosynthesis protein
MTTPTLLPIGDTLRLAAALLLAAASLPAAAAFGFEDVSRRAEALAAKSYRAPQAKLPAVLRDITYDQYRAIRFLPGKALWRDKGLPFELQFFHPGFLFQQTVRVNIVTQEGVRPYRFDPEDFSYGKLDIDKKALRDLGYAGFRIHYPINKQEYKDEIATFLGASYFRALGRNQVYGLSARGLAVDTAAPSGEEVPTFRELWVEWPSPDASEVVVYALLDSRRVAGAYRFVIRPGATTAMDVRARLFPREVIGKLGLAPLSSMYFFGENQPAPTGDYRPEVHDSDGLSILASNGEWIWRPLVNPKRLLVTSFAQRDVRGFGLLQRDRAFAHYEDLEARYDRRPSAWIEPQGDWGAGRVELVQIPTADEFNDNVVAYWVPDQPPVAGKPFDFSYRLSWQMDREAAPPSSRVTQTRRGAVDKDSTRFIVDFQGPMLSALDAGATVDAVVWCDTHGEVLEHQVFRNEATGGWRMSLRVRRASADEPVELRAFLVTEDATLSETWSYLWPAQ